MKEEQRKQKIKRRIQTCNQHRNRCQTHEFRREREDQARSPKQYAPPPVSRINITY